MMYNDAHRLEYTMPKTKNEIIRITVSVPTEHHEQLEGLAEQNKVSVAWVVRDAIEKYLTGTSASQANSKDIS
jgi:metal-responsive CopG/Arc/MetJ family transcriptional regulator